MTHDQDPRNRLPGGGIDSDYKDEWTTGEDGTVSKRVDPGSYEITENPFPPHIISQKRNRNGSRPSA
ncbi:MAG: hypothetical protein ACLRJV_17500 [Eubacteriales bacterium]